MVGWPNRFLMAGVGQPDRLPDQLEMTGISSRSMPISSFRLMVLTDLKVLAGPSCTQIRSEAVFFVTTDEGASIDGRAARVN
jgi:hypothetical protein